MENKLKEKYNNRKFQLLLSFHGWSLSLLGLRESRAAKLHTLQGCHSYHGLCALCPQCCTLYSLYDSTVRL